MLFRSGRLGFEEKPYPQAERLLSALTKAQGIDTALIAQEAQRMGLTGNDIGQKIHAARVEAVGH